MFSVQKSAHTSRHCLQRMSVLSHVPRATIGLHSGVNPVQFLDGVHLPAGCRAKSARAKPGKQAWQDPAWLQDALADLATCSCAPITESCPAVHAPIVCGTASMCDGLDG